MVETLASNAPTCNGGAIHTDGISTVPDRRIEGRPIVRFWPFRARRQITGVSVSPTGIGVNWANLASDRDIACNCLTLLEDHRVLYLASHREHPVSCVASANELRHKLRGPMEQCRSGDLRNALRGIQAAAREFVTELEGFDRTHGWDDDWRSTVGFLDNALSAFRSLVGVQVARIVDEFGLDIDGDLARILPGRFER